MPKLIKTNPFGQQIDASEVAADVATQAELDAAVAAAIGGYARAIDSMKVFEGVFALSGSNGQIGRGASASAIWSDLHPRIILGRTDEAAKTFFPTNTLIEYCVDIDAKDNADTAAQTVVSPAGGTSALGPKLIYYGQSHATKPGNVEIETVKDSDGATETTTLADWAAGTHDFWEFLVTVKANSATATARIYDLVVKRNGATVATLASRRCTSALNPNTAMLSEVGMGTATFQASPMAAPQYRITLP